MFNFIIIDNIQFEDIDFSLTTRSRNNRTCSKCNSTGHTITKCPMNLCGYYCKLPGHISSSCPLKKQESQARKRIRNMSPEQIQRQRENDLADNMSPEQVEQHNASNRRKYILDIVAYTFFIDTFFMATLFSWHFHFFNGY